MMKLGKRGFQVFKETRRWVAFGGNVIEDCGYFIQEWTGWRWKLYNYNCTKLFKNYAEAKAAAERLAATARAERENRRSLGTFQEPVEEIIWV